MVLVALAMGGSSIHRIHLTKLFSFRGLMSQIFRVHTSRRGALNTLQTHFFLALNSGLAEPFSSRPKRGAS